MRRADFTWCTAHYIAVRIAMHEIEFPSSATHNTTQRTHTLYLWGFCTRDNIICIARIQHIQYTNVVLHRLWPHNDFSCAISAQQQQQQQRNTFKQLSQWVVYFCSKPVYYCDYCNFLLSYMFHFLSLVFFFVCLLDDILDLSRHATFQLFRAMTHLPFHTLILCTRLL